MERTKELAVEFVEQAYKEYFVDKSSDFIMQNCISYDIALFGLENTDWVENFEIVSEHHHVDKVDGDVYLIATRISLRDITGNMENTKKVLIDGTIICRYIEENFKICGLHISGTDKFNFVKFSDEMSDLVYKKVLDYTYDVIFECDVMNNIFRYDPDKYKELFEVDTHFVSADQWFWHMCTESLHQQDTEKLDIFRNNDIGKRIHSQEYVIEDDIRIKNSIKGYIWIKMVVIFIPNAKKTNLSKIFVMFKNIDEKKRRDLDYITRAHTDSLTGLYNREHTEHKIKEFLDKEHGNHGIFVVIDIDDFKKINDTFGHITGDELLKKISDRLYNSVGNNDVVGRIGGDEFVIFMKNIDDEKIAKSRIANILDEIQFDYLEKNNSFNIRCSAGAVLTGGSDDVVKIYETADKNLYIAKRAGKNTFRISSI